MVRDLFDHRLRSRRTTLASAFNPKRLPRVQRSHTRYPVSAQWRLRPRQIACTALQAPVPLREAIRLHPNLARQAAADPIFAKMRAFAEFKRLIAR
jgi:hypothetical protein